MTPFEEFCKEHQVSTTSTFRVVDGMQCFIGDLIKIYSDDGTYWPIFKRDDGRRICPLLSHILPEFFKENSSTARWDYAEAERLKKVANDAVAEYNAYISCLPKTDFIKIQTEE